MLNHFLKVLLRVSFKNKSYSLINIGGLAIGMTAFLSHQYICME